jgi:hypothetical protein
MLILRNVISVTDYMYCACYMRSRLSCLTCRLYSNQVVICIAVQYKNMNMYDHSTYLHIFNNLTSSTMYLHSS